VTVDFKNNIIIMTSNLGSEIILKEKDRKKINTTIWELLHKNFKPEFLNRLDSVVIYNALTPKNLMKIAEIQLQDLKQRLTENDIQLEISEDVIMYFAEIGFDPIFGARPLRRSIEEKLVDEIALKIIDGEIKPGDKLKPMIVNGDLIV